jgi:hypothetical protein
MGTNNTLEDKFRRVWEVVSPLKRRIEKLEKDLEELYGRVDQSVPLPIAPRQGEGKCVGCERPMCLLPSTENGACQRCAVDLLEHIATLLDAIDPSLKKSFDAEDSPLPDLVASGAVIAKGWKDIVTRYSQIMVAVQDVLNKG